MDIDDGSTACQVISDENTPPQVTEEFLVGKILQFAKLDLNTLNSNVQQLYFAPSLLQNDIKLLELNPSVEQHIKENGGKLVLKGNSSENCVLCTQNQTFEVKDTEISNSLLLVPGTRLEFQKDDKIISDPVFAGEKDLHPALSLSEIYVDSVCHSYLELRAVQPKINQLLTLLEPSSYDGPGMEDPDVRKFTLEEIFTETSASDGEIRNTLFQQHAVELDGHIRLINFDYMSRVIGCITDLIDENSWHFSSFSYDITLNTLSDIYPKEIVKHLLQSYGSAVSTTDSETSDIWCLNEAKVCRYFAEMLLKPTRKFNLGEFMDAWKDSVPEGMLTCLSQLDGMAIADESSEPAVMRYFPVEQLSEDVKTRFEQLFGVKRAWTLEQITPYVKPLCIGKLTVTVLVMKNARAFTKGGTKYFTSKYIKN